MFSVVIPLYNKELSIKNTMQSVLQQTYQEFEIVIVNDGSTDKSLEYVSELKDSRIRIVNKENGGVSSARNTGIKEAKFEWIAFLDGDDLWDFNHLDEINYSINCFPDKYVFTTSVRFSDNTPLFQHERISNPFVIENFFKIARKEIVMCSSTVVIHKRCFVDVGYFNESISRGEDADMWWRLAEKFDIVKNSNITATYRVEAENRSDSVAYDIRKSIIYYYNLNFISKNFFDTERKKDVLRAFLRCLKNREIANCYYIIKKHHVKMFFPFL